MVGCTYVYLVGECVGAFVLRCEDCHQKFHDKLAE